VPAHVEVASAASMTSSPHATVLPPRFRRNLISVYLSFAITAAVVVVMTPVLVHGLGKDGFALWVVLTSLAPYATLLDFGLGSATVKYVAEYHRRDPDLMSRTVSTSFWTLTIIGLALLVVGVPFSFAFPTLFDIGSANASTATLAMLIFTVSAAASLPASTFAATLMGLQRYDITNFSFVAVLAAQGIAWTIILAMGGGIVELAVATVTLDAAGHVARFVAVRRILETTGVRRALFDRRVAGRLMRLSGWIAVGEATTVVIHRIDPIVVASVAGVPAAGVYSVGQRVAVGAEGVIRPTLTGFFPHASRLSGNDDRRYEIDTRGGRPRMPDGSNSRCASDTCVGRKRIRKRRTGNGIPRAGNGDRRHHTDGLPNASRGGAPARDSEDLGIRSGTQSRPQHHLWIDLRLDRRRSSDLRRDSSYAFLHHHPVCLS
jgi:hypothetical protein